jgi:broad specificity phosphatase PhoE
VTGTPPKKQFDNPTLLLVEHGETDFSGNNDKTERIHGTKYDLPLTLEGHRQAAECADKLKDYDIGSLKTSPQLRAKQTAEVIGDAIGHKPEEDEDLKPLDAGYLSGMTHDAAKSRIEYYVKNPHKQIPDGEKYGDWWDTASERMAHRLKETESLHKGTGQGAADVLHSSEIASMPNIIRGDPPTIWGRQIPGSGKVSAVEKKGGKWHYTPHWEG